MIGDLKKQLTMLYEDRRFCQTIRETKQNISNGIVSNSDVYFGDVYKTFTQSSTGLDISLVINTDGFNVFQSSRTEPWIVMLTVNELPYNKRILLKNCILLGIFIGDKKPDFTKILPLLFEGQVSIFSEGIIVEGQRHMIQLIQNVCDKPARASMLNMSGHRSDHGCVFCYQIQQSTVVQGKRCFYFPISDALSLLRDDNSFRAAGISADSTGTPEFGIKGTCFLCSIPHFRPITGSVIDQLHCINGVGKKILVLILKNYPEIEATINRFIRTLKPPTTFVKRLRSLDNIGNFRGHEFRTFFLYYGIPALEGLVPEPCLNLVKSFNAIICKSNQDIITNQLLVELTENLDEFFELFTDVFGIHTMTINVHELCHLVENIKLNGAGYANSTFTFENFNYLIKKFKHGTRFTDKELFKRFTLYSTGLRSVNLDVDDEEYINLVLSLVSSVKKIKVSKNLGNGIYLVGREESVSNPDEIFPGCDFTNPFIFHRMLCNDVYFTSYIYDHGLKYSNHTIFSGTLNKCFKIHMFYGDLNVSGYTVIAKGKLYECYKTGVNLYRLSLISDHHILEDFNPFKPCFLVKEDLIAISPNDYELY